ncbi:MAG: hypothetical protein ACN6PN_02535 [Sphingobacterium sp.]
MITITIAAIATFVGDQILQDIFKETILNRFRNFLFPKLSYRNQLEETIVQVVNNYRTIHPSTGEGVRFFEQEVIFSYLSKYTLYDIGNKKFISEFFESRPDIDLPTQVELEDFFALFVQKINSNKYLHDIYVEENYKSRIFLVSRQLAEISNQIEKILLVTDYSHINSIPFHLKRKEEDLLLSKLKVDNILLLTGISFCGKTQFAKVIANRITEEGLQFLESNDIDECVDKLKRKGQNQTVYILDDPFGHIYDDNSQNNWRKLDRFLRAFPKEHYLIVCSRIEVITAINGNEGLNCCSINNLYWNDLTVNDPDFIESYWKEIVKIKNIETRFADSFINTLMKNFDKEKLQPGHLEFLSNKSFQDFESMDFEQLVLTAKADSKEIANSISDNHLLTKIYIALGFTCSTIEYVHLTDLAYILSEDKFQPGFFKKKNTKIELVEFRKEDPMFPSYSAGIELSEEHLRSLSLLQKRGYIEISDRQIRFRHPTYFDVSKYLISFQNLMIETIIDDILPNSLSGLNDKVSLSASKQLWILYGLKEYRRKDLCELAIETIKRTIFPSLKDKLVSDSIKIFEDFPPNGKDLILSLIQNGISTSSIVWSGDQPFYSKRHISFFDFLNPEFDINVLKGYVELVNLDQKINKRQLWDLVRGLDQEIFQLLTSKGILNIINNDEVFIRAKAANRLFMYGLPDFEIVEEIFSDSHPGVIIEAIKGIFLGLNIYNTDQRSFICEKMKCSLKNSMVGLRGNSFFSSFGLSHAADTIKIDELPKNEAAVLWNIWGSLFPAFLANYPVQMAFVNSPRFSENLRRGLSFLEEDARLSIGMSLYSWIDIRLNNNISLDSHELFVIPCIYEQSTEYSIERQSLLKKCLNHWHTGFVTSSLAKVFWYWEKLSENEVNCIREVLKSNRMDKRWLKAVSITRGEIYPEIQKELFDEADFFDKPIKLILEKFEDNLLLDAVILMFHGVGPISQYSFNHDYSKIWLDIVETIIFEEKEPCYSICLDEMVIEYANGGCNNRNYWNDVKAIWIKHCKNTKDKAPLLNSLIKATVSSSYVIIETRFLWETLLDSYGENGDVAFKEIAKYTEGMQLHDPEGDEFIEILSKYKDTLILLEEFDLDRRVLNLAASLNAPNNEIAFELTDKIDEILELSKSMSVKLKFTFKVLELITNNYPLYKKTLSKLSVLPNYILKIGQEQRESFYSNFNIENWYEKY